jgi:hypothetical protein
LGRQRFGKVDPAIKRIIQATTSLRLFRCWLLRVIDVANVCSWIQVFANSHRACQQSRERSRPSAKRDRAPSRTPDLTSRRSPPKIVESFPSSER